MGMSSSEKRRRRPPARAGLLSWAGAALWVCAALAACGAVPEVDGEIPTTADAGAPRIVGHDGPLSPEEARAVLAEITDDPGEAGLLARHAALEQEVAETPLVAGNRVRLLRDGPETFRVVFDLIRNARDHVNLEFYILEDVESDGTKLGDLLVAKRGEGVAVNIIYDSHGSQETPPAFFERLRQAGVQVIEYNPLNPLDSGLPYEPNDRNHRKIVVVDGRYGITGGINLSHTYQSTHPDPGDLPADGMSWRDTSVLVEGPVVAQFQRLFIEHWRQQNGPPLDTDGFFPKVEPSGDEVVRVIGSSPEDALPRYYVSVLTAIRNAELRVWLTAAYFVPTEQELADLTAAARRGVDLRILVPGVTDIPTTIDIARSYYGELMEAGVRIWEAQNVLLHSKSIVVDGVWSIVGSSNFDYRSVIFNDEVDAIVLGSETGREMERMFEADLAQAKEIDPEAWADRPFTQRVKEHMSRLWQVWF
ncbi:MAG: cardiolipin synthase B [Alphaproteobacteria bacterium]|nr:MAG: cardiolipin synthase B [Alphaproteobacteria bacterium]